MHTRDSGIYCEACGEQFDTPLEPVGQLDRCPSCGEIVRSQPTRRSEAAGSGLIFSLLSAGIFVARLFIQDISPQWRLAMLIVSALLCCAAMACSGVGLWRSKGIADSVSGLTGLLVAIAVAVLILHIFLS